MPGAFQCHIDAIVGHLGRIPLGGDLDRAPDAPVVADCDRIARYFELTGKATMYAVVMEKVRIGLGAAEIVDRNGHDIVAPTLDQCTQHEAADPPEPVDGDLDGH